MTQHKDINKVIIEKSDGEKNKENKIETKRG